MNVSNLASHLNKVNKKDDCFIYDEVKRRNNASFLGISGFEGIPQNVCINLFCWMVCFGLFIILRKKAWNYGRMAVVQKEEIKWADMFYGTNDGDEVSLTSFASASGAPVLVVAQNKSEEGIGHDVPHVTTSALKSVEESNTGIPDELLVRGHDPKRMRLSAQSMNMEEGKSPQNGNLMSPSSSQKISNVSEIMDKGYFSWIKIVLTLTDKQYREKCGPDCLHYLSFQRHLIVLGIIITFCSLCIVLPVNLSGDFKSDRDRSMTEANVTFSDTTITNLVNKHDLLWCHVFIAILFLLISIFVMRHFSKELEISTEDLTEEPSRTVQIIGLNRKNCNEEMLRAHLAETYPGTEVVDVSFAYSIKTLERMEFERLSAASAKVYFQEVYDKKKEQDANAHRPMIKPYMCGHIACGCCRCCKETDAVEYYSKLEYELAEKVEIERKKALTKPLGIAYVTFSSLESAENIVEDYACSARIFLHAPVSKYTGELHSNQWIVKFAPKPENICWENLGADYKIWYAKWIVVNVFVLVIAVFVSTPVVLFQIPVFPKINKTTGQVEVSKLLEGDTTVFRALLWDTIPTVIFWILSVFMIWIVIRSDLIIGYWTKSSGNLSEMIKAFGFLVFMIIILPSLGISSILRLLEKDTVWRWSCIFYQGNGAFFVNYVCTSSLVGTAAELMRLPDLFVYAIRICLARSEAETAAIRKSLLWDFQIGVSYAWTMLHFAIFTCFSVIFPLVTPFGLIYLLLKHFTDRYNIYFAYAPCKVDNSVHATAVNFVMMSMFMLQLNLLAYVHFHIGDNQYHDSNSDDSKIRALQICSLLGFSITAAFFLGQCCFNICGDFSPIQQQKNPEVESIGSDGGGRKPRPSVDSNMFNQTSGPRIGSSGGRDNNTLLGAHTSSREAGVSYHSGHTEGGMSTRSYGRYIPALLRPELLRPHERDRDRAPEIVPRQGDNGSVNKK